MREFLHPHKEMIEILLSGGLFIGLCINGVFFTTFDFFNTVYSLLAYIVLLEVVRMVGQYLFAHQRQIRLVIDTFIIFTLREVILTFSDKSMTLEVKSFYIVTGFLIMFMLYYFRKRAMIESPNETNCTSCLAKDSCLNSKVDEK